MDSDGEIQATAEIIAGAGSHSTSPNGYGTAPAASTMPNPALVAGAALLAGLLLARVVRRIRG
jgi:hypothetical protein